MTRRRWLAVGVGACAALAGAGAAWWRSHSHDGQPDIWSLRFPTPGGGELALSQWRGKPLLLNFWATWCPPCVEEMPLLARFQHEHGAEGWQVIGLAVDREKPVQEFIAAQQIDFPIAMAGTEGIALSRALGNTAGGLPFSIAYDPRGAVLAHKVGALNSATLAGWAKLANAAPSQKSSKTM
jgi:thiol-disulfide isomerase/thioredoxin